MSQPLEIISTKVSIEEKQKIDENAAFFNVSRSEFIRTMLLSRMEKLEQFLQLPPSVIVNNEDAAEVGNLIDELQSKYPNTDNSKIIKSALMLALKNEKLLASFKIKNFF